MLPRAEAPARRLPYTTADMSERLAKRKAEQEAAAQAKANQALRFGVTNPPAVKKDEPWYKDALGAVGGAIKSVYDNMPMSNPISTPVNMGGNAGVSMGGQGTGKSLVTEPARLAVRRAVGDITAIPRVGADSPSYTADQIREQGVVPGVLGAAIDYSQFIPVVAKGAGFTGDAVNAYKLAMMERQANPFPALRGATNVIDVVPGSRLPARIVDAPTPATRLAQAQTQLPRATTADMAEQLARAQARQQTHFGTVSKEPIEQLQSKEFDRISPINPYSGGVPDPMFEAKDAYSLPVYEIGGEKIAFGNPSLGRFDPEFNAQDVKIIPANPYDITGLPKTSVEGRQFGELYFDAMNGFTMENASSFRDTNLGQVPALIYAASRGDNIAMQELQRLATVAKTKMAADKMEYINNDLKNIKTDWSQTNDVMVQTKDALGYRTEHPLNIDDIVMTHQTNFAPEIDPATGQRFIRPTQDHTPIDPATGKPWLDPITGKPKPNPDQINIHMAANHVVMGHMSRNQPTSGGYVITGPLRDLLDANPGSLNNLQPVDSWFTPPPGEGLILPDSWRIIKTPGIDKYKYQTPAGNPDLDWTRRQQQIHTFILDKLEKEIDDLVKANMSEIAKLHNKSNDYQFNEIAKGVHGSSTDINNRFKQIAGEIIPQEYPEYVGGVTSQKHTGTPSHDNQTTSVYDPVDTRRSGMFVMYPWMLSPNAKLRYFDSNKFTTGKITTISEAPSFG